MREQGTPRGQRFPAEGIGLLCPSGARSPVLQMIAFIKERREVCGIEPMRCILLMVSLTPTCIPPLTEPRQGFRSVQARREIN